MTDPIPLSALNQYAYCPRRCYLIHGEGEFADNVHTLSGTLEHERVDTLHHELKAGVRVEFGLPVWSDRLGLSGRCDVVEFQKAYFGHRAEQRTGLSGRCDVVEFQPGGAIYPVEYKHGKRRPWPNDDLQLAGQALCLAEMTGRAVPKGAIFHTQSKRRREVVVDAGLAERVAETAAAIRAMLAGGAAPPPLADPKRCGECSMRDICRPELLKSSDVIERLAAGLFEPDGAADY